jgi:serine/threonine protein kinase
VVLDEIYNAKLCDFGLVTQFSHNNTHHSTDNVRGTRGYVDPAYADTGRSSQQSDIYSFGILMLEVVCCEKPIVTRDGERTWNSLVERVRACHRRNAILEAADGRLRGDRYDDQLKRVLMIGLLCVQPNRSDRPRTTVVLECLASENGPLPFLAPGNYALSTVSETGSAASTTHNRNPAAGEEVYSTSSNVFLE